MAAVKDAFQEVVGERAACIGATMQYDHVDDHTENQVFTFRVIAGDVETTVTKTIAGGASPIQAAKQAATDYLATL